jgi:predicted PurR-regulated permease PerM
MESGVVQDVQWVRKVVQWLVIGLPVVALVWIWLPFLNAILLATVISVLAYGPYQRSKSWWLSRLRKRGEGMADNMASLTVIVGLLVAVAVPLTLIGILLVAQVNSVVQDLKASAPNAGTAFSVDSVVAQANDALAPVLQRMAGTQFDLESWFQTNRQGLTSTLGKAAGSLAYTLGHGLLMLVIAFLTAFFMLRDGHRLREPLMRFIPLPRDGIQRILDRVQGTVSAVFVGVLLVGVAQGSLAGVAYGIAGIPNALMWSVVTIVLCWIPLLGAPLIYVPMSLLLMSQGRVVPGVLLLAFGFGVVSQIDNLLKPLVIGARTQLHTMAVFFSLLGGVLVMGPIGLFAGPIVLTLVLSLYDVVCGGEEGIATATPSADATSSP